MKKLSLLAAMVVFLAACKAKERPVSNDDKGGKPACNSYIVDADLYNADSDPFELKDARLEGKNLMIDVEYGGGCGGADFTLAHNGIMTKSLPPQMTLKLHLTDNDHCRALVQKTLCYDISQLYGGKTFIVRLNGVDKTFRYEGRD